jgi:hypothetical protein
MEITPFKTKESVMAQIIDLREIQNLQSMVSNALAAEGYTIGGWSVCGETWLMEELLSGTPAGKAGKLIGELADDRLAVTFWVIKEKGKLLEFVALQVQDYDQEDGVNEAMEEQGLIQKGEDACIPEKGFDRHDTEETFLIFDLDANVIGLYHCEGTDQRLRDYLAREFG